MSIIESLIITERVVVDIVTIVEGVTISFAEDIVVPMYTGGAMVLHIGT